MNEVYEFIKSCGTYYLATVEDGKPHVRPFGTIDIFEGKMFIQTGLNKPVAQQMLANPAVEISCMSQDGKWLRLSAEANLVDSVEAQDHMLDGYPHLRAVYTPGDGNTAVFAIENATAQICSFTEAPVTIEF